MSQDSNTEHSQQTISAELRDSQNSALLATSTIIIFSVIYWAIQIESVKSRPYICVPPRPRFDHCG